MITLTKEDDSNIESFCVTSDARHPRVCMRKKRDMTENGPFVSFLPGFGLSGLVMACLVCVWPSYTLYNLTICKIVICVQPSNSINLNYDIVLS